MSRKLSKELLPVIQAYVDGKKIECRVRNSSNPWVAVDSPQWMPAIEYRVALEKVTIVRFHPVFLSTGGSITGSGMYASEEEAREWVEKNKGRFMSALSVARVTTEYER